MIPYGRQNISADDVDAVVEVLQSDWLTTGPKVSEFEAALGQFSTAQHAVVFSSGTAALHAAMDAIGLQVGDEVVVPAISFVATANCVVYQGGTPIFADINPHTLLIDIDNVRRKISPRTRAVIAMDYAGQPCDYLALRELCDEHGLILVADACHSLGATVNDIPVGRLADLTVFSFHPVKSITTGEGGALVTESEEYAQRAKTFRNHGIDSDHHQRAQQGAWRYDMHSLGFNYRLTDIQAALGISQLAKLPNWIARRQEIAKLYDGELSGIPGVTPLSVSDKVGHAYHLYVIKLESGQEGITRDELFDRLRDAGIGVNVHYLPIFQHSFYRNNYPVDESLYPNACSVAESILSLPIYPAMSDQDVMTVVTELKRALVA